MNITPQTAPQALTPASPSTTDRARDPQHFRRVLGHYPTGVTVVTAVGEDGLAEGMVVGSFTSVSLDPPLVAFLPAAGSRSWSRLRNARRFCVNILGSDQEHLCRQFAARTGDKYDGVSWRPGPSGSPVIEGAVAWVDCETDVIHAAGDHDIVIGKVIDLDTAAESDPLLFFQGGYGSFTPHLLVASDDRYLDELDLIDRSRHLLEGTARSLRGQVAVAHCDGKVLTVLATAGRLRLADEEAQLVSALAQDPSAFVASRFQPTETIADHPEVRSVWSPVLGLHGAVTLGVMATGFSADEPLDAVAQAVRHLATAISALTGPSHAHHRADAANDTSADTDQPAARCAEGES